MMMNSPALPTEGVAAVMTSPEWLAAGSDIEAGEAAGEHGKGAGGKNLEGMQPSTSYSELSYPLRGVYTRICMMYVMIMRMF